MSKVTWFKKYWEKREKLSPERLYPTSVFSLRHLNN